MFGHAIKTMSNIIFPAFKTFDHLFSIYNNNNKNNNRLLIIITIDNMNDMNSVYEKTQFEHFVRSFISNCGKSIRQREKSWNDERDKYQHSLNDSEKIFKIELREINAKVSNTHCII